MSQPEFKVGDKIRVISIPQSALSMPPEMRDGEDGTLTAFRYLLESKATWTVVEVDAYRGWPWVEFWMGDHYHKLMIEPECIERVSR